MESIQSVKQRFGIIGNNEKLNRALEKSIQVSNSDISVLVTGESGVGKENIPKIIHQYSHRKHAKYIAVNWIFIRFYYSMSVKTYYFINKFRSKPVHY